MDIDQNAPVITRDEIVIAAPVGTVWNLFADISAWLDWNKDIESASLDGPLSVGATFRWRTAGMDITSTVDEWVPQQGVAWSGLVQGILGIHVWRFTPVAGGTLVQTEESWDGEPVRAAQPGLMQQALDRSIRSWLESLKREADSRA